MHLTATVIAVLIGTCSALGQQPAKTNVDRDLLAIEDLHKKDIAAAKVGDVIRSQLFGPMTRWLFP